MTSPMIRHLTQTLLVGAVMGSTLAPQAAQARATATGSIAFESIVDGLHQILIMSADGQHPFQLTKRANNEHPVWSPDGRQLAFLSDRADGTFQLFTITVDTLVLRQLTSDHTVKADPSWLAGGTAVVYDATDANHNSQLFNYNISTGKTKNLSNDSAHNYSMPAASPDGKLLAYVTDSTKSGKPEIAIMNLAGTGSPTQVTDLQADQIEFPAWSPNGKQILFDATVSGHQAVYVMDPNGDNQKKVVNNDTSGWYPRWSPDGTQILYQTGQSDSLAVYIADGDGGNSTKLGDQSSMGFADWTKAVHVAVTANSGASSGQTQPTVAPSSGNQPKATTVPSNPPPAAGKGTLVMVNQLAVTLHVVIASAHVDFNMGPNSSQSVSLDAGTYDVNVSAPDFQAMDQSITIVAGQTFHYTLHG